MVIMDIKDLLGGRLGVREIVMICSCCRGEVNDEVKEMLYALVADDDERVGYNSLWVFTHFDKDDKAWLRPKRNELIDYLLGVQHEGKRRLILNLLDSQYIGKEDVRADYLDFCLSAINSTEPYGIRALCIKQAFAQCRFFPELLGELKSELEIMEMGELSPGLLSVRRNILKKISRESIRDKKA